MVELVPGNGCLVLPHILKPLVNSSCIQTFLDDGGVELSVEPSDCNVSGTWLGAENNSTKRVASHCTGSGYLGPKMGRSHVMARYEDMTIVEILKSRASRHSKIMDLACGLHISLPYAILV